MELGKRILQARQEAGLSQRQLCGGVITRNMLSQIEHGTARPSMDTLRYLAGRLGKPVSYFLEEDAVLSPNQQVMAAARKAYGAGDSSGALKALEDYKAPDAVFDWEWALLRCICLQEQARQAMEQGKLPYARELLEQAEQAEAQTPYLTQALEHQRLKLLLQAQPQKRKLILAKIAPEEDLLLLRAEDALEDGELGRSAALLEAVQDRTQPMWNLLRGRVALEQGDSAAAAPYLRSAEAAYPRETAPLLERCYRELGDYQQAYYYACKQR